LNRLTRLDLLARSKGIRFTVLALFLCFATLHSAVGAFADSNRREGEKKTSAASSNVSNSTGEAAVRDEKKTDGVADSGSDKAANTSSKAAAPETLDRIRALEEALKSQNDRLDQLRKTIEEQQRTIQMLMGSGNAAAGAPIPASSSSSPAPEAPPAAAASTPATTATAQNQPPSIEDRLKKVEESALRIGPLRLSGDFRLRMDATWRPATEPPDPALQHLQNIRMRYRLRLNMDTDLNKFVSFHGQLATGPFNNAVTQDQDFTSTVARAPFLISEAWADVHPNKNIQLQGGRVVEVFADNSRFIFDDDVRFNGFNERFVLPFGSTEKAGSIEFRAGQYWFSNPNVAIITPGSPLATAGAEVGTIGRSAMLFHQGIMWNQKFNGHWSQQLGADVQAFREPNQIQLASTANGVVFLVQPGLGVTLSGPLTGTGNATTTAGGAIYTAENFHVARFTYRLDHTGFHVGDHPYPITFNLQGARNFGTDANERDAMLTSLQVGRVSKFADMSFLYIFSIKGANAIISQLTDDDLGTGTGVNLRTHHFRWDLGITRNITLQSLVFIQNELRSSGQFPNFFVPLSAFTPRQYRVQEQILFRF
jgi:putative porin